VPTTNRNMNDMLRKKRGELEDYMYKGEPDAAVVITAAPDDEAAEVIPDNEAAAGETAGLTVLAPGEEDPPDMYVYAQGETPGAWTMYPPGVPCDTGTTRVALDHPATAADLARMDEAVGTEEPVEPAYEAEEEMV
jgi:hypothetical protein